MVVSNRLPWSDTNAKGIRMNDIDMGAVIARKRREAGLTQEQLATQFDVTKAAVSKWELGQSLPDVSLLPRIASFFGISLDELFSWNRQMTAEEVEAESARISSLFATDADAAYRELASVTASHASCWAWLLSAASMYSVRATVDEARSDELRGLAMQALDRIEDRCGEVRALRQARQLRAGMLAQQADNVPEAVSILEDLIDPIPGSASSLLGNLYIRTGRAEEARALRERDLYCAIGSITAALCGEMGEVAADAGEWHQAGAGKQRQTDERRRADALVRAAEGLVDGFDLETVVPPTALSLHVEVAAMQARLGRTEEAVRSLARFADVAERYCQRGCPMRGLEPSPLFPSTLDPTRADLTLKPLLGIRMEASVTAMARGRREWDTLAGDSEFQRVHARIEALGGR